MCVVSYIMVQAWAPRLANPALISMARYPRDSPAKLEYIYPDPLPPWTQPHWLITFDNPKHVKDAAPNTSWGTTTDKSNGEDREWWRDRDQEKKYLRKV